MFTMLNRFFERSTLRRSIRPLVVWLLGSVTVLFNYGDVLLMILLWLLLLMWMQECDCRMHRQCLLPQKISVVVAMSYCYGYTYYLVLYLD